jgi:hypothetical protein
VLTQLKALDPLKALRLACLQIKNTAKIVSAPIQATQEIAAAWRALMHLCGSYAGVDQEVRQTSSFRERKDSTQYCTDRHQRVFVLMRIDDSAIKVRKRSKPFNPQPTIGFAQAMARRVGLVKACTLSPLATESKKSGFGLQTLF